MGDYPGDDQNSSENPFFCSSTAKSGPELLSEVGKRMVNTSEDDLAKNLKKLTKNIKGNTRKRKTRSKI